MILLSDIKVLTMCQCQPYEASPNAQGMTKLTRSGQYNISVRQFKMNPCSFSTSN